MRAPTIAFGLLSLLLPLTAAGQSDHPGASSPGTILSLPNPDLPASQLERYEIPELAGATPVTGSMLVDGRLPKPVIDYGVNANGISQSVTIFENGLTSVRIDSGAVRIRKRLMLPVDALATYRRRISPETLEGTSFLSFSQGGVYEFIRAWDEDGSFIERRFDPAVVLPYQLELQRSLLQDVIRAAGHDREVTNPLTGYDPRVGDRLVREDQKLFEVTRIVENLFVELKCASEPTKMYVAIADLQQLFVGIQTAVAR